MGIYHPKSKVLHHHMWPPLPFTSSLTSCPLVTLVTNLLVSVSMSFCLVFLFVHVLLSGLHSTYQWNPEPLLNVSSVAGALLGIADLEIDLLLLFTFNNSYHWGRVCMCVSVCVYTPVLRGLRWTFISYIPHDKYSINICHFKGENSIGDIMYITLHRN